MNETLTGHILEVEEVVMAFGGDFAESDPHCPLRGDQPQFTTPA